MKELFRYIVLAIMIVAGYWPAALPAQNVFTARVVDAESGEALPMVGVYVSENNATLTNFDGDFSIQADSADVLRLTCIGRENIEIRAGALPEVVRMRMITSTLSEVTVKAVEGILLQSARKTEKYYKRRKSKEAQYFYRQTTVLSQKQDIVEAFVAARSAVNLRELTFLTGRHGLLSEAAWRKSDVEDMNLHHLLELGPMTSDAQFWELLITPLISKGGQRTELVRGDDGNVRRAFVNHSALEYLQRYYHITMDEMDGADQHLYRFRLERRADVVVENPIMTGTLYVDRATLNPMAFDGQVENLKMSFGKGQLRSATVVPVTFDFHLDYAYERRFAEVANLSVSARWGEFQTRTLLFNVENQARLRVGRKSARSRSRSGENMLASITEAGYDSTYWANNEVVKRTAHEQAVAQGAVDLAKARLDSVAAYQASLTPLGRLADRLERFGKAVPQEKVYVHLDNTSYFLGDTIWFAAYTRRTNEDRPSGISRVLYCELWNHDGFLVERKLVEMKDGRGHGFFELPDTLYSGYFELRAYTRWQLNWGQTEHYHEWSSEYWFYNKAMAKDFFRDYEKLYSRVFPVYDKPHEPGDFYRDMTLRPLRRYFKSAPKEPELRLSLFPEGGNLVAGVPCRVAFEAATAEGEVREGSVEVWHGKQRVELMAERGETVASVRTENRGRGTFIFTPEEGEKYEVVFTADDATSINKKKKKHEVRQDIKAEKADGVALQVHRDSTGNWLFDIAARGEAARHSLGLTVMREGCLQTFEELDGSKPVQLIFSPRPASSPSTSPTASSSPSTSPTVSSSQVRWSAVSPPTNSPIGDTPSATALPGVYQVTVFDSIGHVYADRLFFVTTPDLVKPTLTVSGVKEQYQPFEKVTLDIAAQSPATTLSLAVRDLVHSDNTFDSGNILTEMLLASEIKGFVPQPQYFFESDDEEHRRALDLLMLTQGWRRFSWQDMAVKGTWELTHPAEHTPIVTGTVNRYYANIAGFDPLYDKVLAEHAAFMGETDTPLSELNEMDTEVTTDFGPDPLPSLSTAQGYDNYNPSVYGTNNSIGRISYGWNLNAQRENLLGREDNNFVAFNSALNAYQPQQSDWRNDDYNALSYRTASDYRQRRQARMRKNARLYLEEGSVKRDVRVHAEFVDLYDERNFLVGETETRHGRFQIDMPRFEGKCVFFLGASDSTLWTKKDRPYKWVQVDFTDEYSSWPLFPEFYVRLNLPYPRWVKPYTYYQVHNAPLRDGSPLAPGLLTDGTHLLDQVTVRTRHGGLRRIDYSKPAYVIDGYEALNRAMDAGLIDYTFSAYEIAEKAAVSLIGDMGMARHYEITTSYDSHPGFYTPYLAQRRQNMLTYLDQIYIYTDYSPRREGDERYEQSNQPSVRVDLRGMPNGGQRLTYRDRRYILDGYAFQEDFYQPDYQRHPPVEGQKDYRRTLYWNPELPLDADGHTRISFFNNSQPTSIAVQAAGQADDGSLLYNRE